MGLIKSMVQSVGGTLHDQWEDLIKCEDMGSNVLMRKVTTKTGQISKGSRIMVAPGQVAVIYDSGNILDATAEEGVFEFDESSSPSFFGGQFGQVFSEMWQRFKYNGTPAKEQAVFYFNAKEIVDNKFGTATPISFQDWSHPIPNQMTGSYQPLGLSIRCYGKYTFKIAEPSVFMRAYAGTSDEVTKDELNEQMRSEVIGSFQKVLNALGNSENKVPVLELPSQSDKIKALMDKDVYDEAIRNRGLQIVGFVIESVTPDEASTQKINNYELSSNSMMQQGTLVGAFSNAVQDAANNSNGAATGIMGVGMMNMASGGMMGGATQAAFNQNANGQQFAQVDPFASKPSEEAASAKFCSECGTPVTGKFCSNCGKQID